MGIGENVGENVGENTGQQGSSLLVPAPTYTPIVADDNSDETLDTEYDGPFGDFFVNKQSDGTTPSILISDTRSHSGTQSQKVIFSHDYNWFGGGGNFPLQYGAGNTIWYRVYFYFPSTLSFSNNAGGDQWGWGKFMLLCPANHQTPRGYLQITSDVQLEYGDAGFADTQLRFVHDNPLGACAAYTSYTVPRDQWVALQWAWKLTSSGNGWSRLWADSTFIGECTQPAVPVGYEVGQWGMGNYWNGKAYIAGSSTGEFWMDDVIITVDEPNTTDSGGRPYIHPDHIPSDF